MTEFSEKVRARGEELDREKYMNSLSGFEITINKPEGIHHFTEYYNSGKQVRSYKDKRRKAEVIVEALH